MRSASFVSDTLKCRTALYAVDRSYLFIAIEMRCCTSMFPASNDELMWQHQSPVFQRNIAATFEPRRCPLLNAHVDANVSRVLKCLLSELGCRRKKESPSRAQSTFRLAACELEEHAALNLLATNWAIVPCRARSEHNLNPLLSMASNEPGVKSPPAW